MRFEFDIRYRQRFECWIQFDIQIFDIRFECWIQFDIQYSTFKFESKIEFEYSIFDINQHLNVDLVQIFEFDIRFRMLDSN